MTNKICERKSFIPACARRSVLRETTRHVPLRVLSSFEEGEGTLITYEEEGMEQALISGIAFNRDEAKLTMLGVPDQPGVAHLILGPVADANIEVDMIIQNTRAGGLTDVTFTVTKADANIAEKLARKVAEEIKAEDVLVADDIAKVSVTGVGMKSHSGVAAKMFSTLAQENINIRLISTSEIRISCVIDKKYAEIAVQALHTAFGLDKE